METWCRTPDQIARSLETVKVLVARANDNYARRLDAESRAVNVSDGETVSISPEQRALNELVEQLVSLHYIS